MRQTITVRYNGKPDDEIDSRIAGLLEFPPLNFKWTGQGYDFKSEIRDISFQRILSNKRKKAKRKEKLCTY